MKRLTPVQRITQGIIYLLAHVLAHSGEEEKEFEALTAIAARPKGPLDDVLAAVRDALCWRGHLITLRLDAGESAEALVFPADPAPGHGAIMFACAAGAGKESVGLVKVVVLQKDHLGEASGVVEAAVGAFPSPGCPTPKVRRARWQVAAVDLETLAAWLSRNSADHFAQPDHPTASAP